MYGDTLKKRITNQSHKKDEEQKDSKEHIQAERQTKKRKPRYPLLIKK